MASFIKALGTVLIVPIAIISILGVSVQSGATPLDNEDSSKVTAFTPESRSSSEICQYVSGIKAKRYGRPRMFGNIGNIYIFNSIETDMDGSLKQEQGSISEEQREQDVEDIAACILYDHVGKYQHPEKYGHYIFTTKVSRNKIDSIHEPGNLSVFISGFKSGIHKKYKEFATEHTQSFDNDIYTLKVIFFRADIFDEYLQDNFCTAAFPATSNKDLFNRLITNALESCLQQQFYNQSE